MGRAYFLINQTVTTQGINRYSCIEIVFVDLANNLYIIQVIHSKKQRAADLIYYIYVPSHSVLFRFPTPKNKGHDHS